MNNSRGIDCLNSNPTKICNLQSSEGIAVIVRQNICFDAQPFLFCHGFSFNMNFPNFISPNEVSTKLISTNAVSTNTNTVSNDIIFSNRV